MNTNIIETNEKISSKNPALEVLKKLGYTFIGAKENKLLRNGNLSNVLLTDILDRKLNELNSYEYLGKKYKFSANTVGKAIKDLNEDLITGLISTNEKIYDILTLGKTYTERMVDGSLRSFDLKYIDFEHPERNEFTVTEEFSVLRMNGKEFAIPDIVLFIE